MSQVKQNESTRPLTPDERLRGVLFQFVQLHNRWSEDRQAFVLQAEKLATVLDQLSEAAQTLGEFEPQVGQEMEAALRAATHRVMQIVLNATGDLKGRTDELNQALGQAQSVLERYMVQTMWSDWKHWITIGLTAISGGVIVGLLVARLMMPTVSLPLTLHEAEELEQGETFSLVWPLLTPAEQKHYEQLAKTADTQKPSKP